MNMSISQRIMLINIDQDFAPSATIALKEQGYEVTNVLSGSDTLRHFENIGFPDMAIIDIDENQSLSGLSIFTMVRELTDFPFLLLTNTNNLDAVIGNVHSQTDDFIHKPVALNELVARTQWLLKRYGHNPQEYTHKHMACSRLKVNFVRRQVTDGKQVLHLSPKESKILYILYQNIGHAVSIPFLRDRIWPDYSSNDSHVRVGILRLRRKLAAKFSCSSLVITEHGLGYRLNNACNTVQLCDHIPSVNGQKHIVMHS